MKSKIFQLSQCIQYFFKNNIALLVFLTSIATLSCQKDELNPSDQDSLKRLGSTSLAGSNGNLVLYYGHKTFTRKSNAPFIETVKLQNPNFEHFDGNFVLKIQNGSDKKTRVSSAEIWIDGVLIAGPSDFSKNVSLISKPITGLTPESILEIKLSSAPGSFLDIWIEGTLKPNHFLVTSEGGEFVFLEGILTLTIPSGAVDNITIISVVDFTNTLTDKQRSNFVHAIEFLPNNIEFKLPILGQLRLPNFNDQEDPILMHIDLSNQCGIEIPSWYDQGSKILSFDLEHFSTYFIGFTRVSKLLKECGYFYSLTPLTFRLDNNTEIKQLQYPSQQVLNFANDDVERAFKHWQTYSTDFNTIFISDPNVTTEADITIGFMPQAEAKKFGLGIFGRSDILDGFAVVLYTYDGDLNIIQRHILLNDDEKWKTSSQLFSLDAVGSLLESITTHEIGHFFGLGEEYSKFRDCKNYLSLMGKVYCRTFPISPFDHDIQNLKNKYDVVTFNYGSVAGIKTLTSNIKINEIEKDIDLPIEFQIFDARGDGVKNATVLFHCSNEKIKILSGVIATTNPEGKVRIDKWKVSEKGSYSIRAYVWIDPKYLTTERCPGFVSIDKFASVDIVATENGQSAQFSNEKYDLDNNQVPLGWEFFETNEEVVLKDGHLIATPIDAYGGLRRNGTMPDGVSKIKFEWDGNLSYTYWGMLNILRLNYGANKDLAVYLETAGVWSTTNNFLFLQENFGSEQRVEREKHLFPLQYGNFHYTVTVTDSDINFVCKDLSNQELYVSKRMNIPSTSVLTLQQMTGFEFITYTTTDNDNWLDNISVTLN